MRLKQNPTSPVLAFHCLANPKLSTFHPWVLRKPVHEALLYLEPDSLLNLGFLLLSETENVVDANQELVSFWMAVTLIRAHPECWKTQHHFHCRKHLVLRVQRKSHHLKTTKAHLINPAANPKTRNSWLKNDSRRMGGCCKAFPGFMYIEEYPTLLLDFGTCSWPLFTS